MDALKLHYPWLRDALAYFEDRLTFATQDTDFTLTWLIENCRTLDDQNTALRALTRKCEILLAQLDALYFSYISPGFIPPGAFNPENENLNDSRTKHLIEHPN